MVNNIRFLLCALACVLSVTSYASDPLEGREERIKQARIAFAKKTYGMSDSEATKKVTAGLQEGKVKQTAKFTGTSSDGSRITATASVTKPVDKAKVASTLTERLNKSKQYAAKVGKASIPSFVGMAAFTALMEGIDWVMDEGGQITKEDIQPIVLDKNTSPYVYHTSDSQGEKVIVYDINAYCSSVTPESYDDGSRVITYTFESSSTVYPSTGCLFKRYFDGVLSPPNMVKQFQRYTNPDYNPSSVPSEPPSSVATNAEIETAVKNALESNNPALAAAIAGAITAAYSPDQTDGQSISDSSTNGLASSSNDDIKDAIATAANNDGTEPNSGGKPGSYTITDGEKTISGQIDPAPVTGTTDTTTTPVIDPVTGQPTGQTSTSGSFDFPPFCDWAAVVCDWLDWTQEEPELPEEDSDIPSELLPVVFTPFQLVNFDATCPPDIPLELQIIGEPISSVFPMQPFCTFFSGMQPFVLLLSMFVSVRIVAGSLNNTVF